MRIGIAAWDLADPDSPELTQTGRDFGHDTTMFYLSDVTCQDTGDRLVPTIKGERVAELLARHERLLCQPYFPHPQGDIRVTVVGDETPMSMNRIPAASGWKSNACMGATAIAIDAPPELAEISRRAAQVMGVTIAGLDFLPTPGGYRIIEFNNCPGWFPVPADVRRHLTERIIEVAVSIRNARRGPAGRVPAARSSW